MKTGSALQVMLYLKTQITPRLTRIIGFLLVAAWNVLPAHATSLTIDPSSLNVTAGQTFSLSVSISGVTDLYAFEFDIGYDPNVLAANTISEGAFLPTGGPTLFIPGIIDNLGGTITATADVLNGAVPGVNGNGVLAVIDFTALTSGSSGINLFNPILLDSTLSDITVDNIQNGSVVVSASPGQVPEPATFALMGIGLAGIGFGRRRNVASKSL
jgi:hypothetical protein